MAQNTTPSTIVAHRFLIESLAGAGGMGSVYRSRDLLTGQAVALKVLHGTATGPQDIERFAREARLLSTLEHPGIVRYVAHGQTPDGQPFIALEWLTGHDLATRLKELPLSVEESLLLLRHVAEALSVAHRRGIVHRDIKPSNIFSVEKRRSCFPRPVCRPGENRGAQELPQLRGGRSSFEAVRSDYRFFFKNTFIASVTLLAS